MFWKVPEFSENPLDTWIETNYETIYETNFPDFGWFREMESAWKTQTSCKNRDVDVVNIDINVEDQCWSMLLINVQINVEHAPP